MANSDSFVRVPTRLLERLLRTKLTGAQWRLLLWVIRQTLGWQRSSVSFTWYRISKDTGMDRAVAYRAGHRLLESGILTTDQNQLKLGVDWAQRGALPPSNADVAPAQPDHCQDATLFRRAKDSLKEKIIEKEQKETGKNDAWHHRSTGGGDKRAALLAGAATPVPGKYDSLSQNR